MSSTTLRLLAGACLVGLVHAAFSLYWALGGRWLIDTVGVWAADAAERHPFATGLTLLVVVCAKATFALAPVLVATGRIGRGWREHRGLLRAGWVISAAGATLLMVYGGLYTAVGWLVLSGVVTADGGYDRSAMLGHAALWDPLFLAWGALLAAGLWTWRRGGSLCGH